MKRLKILLAVLGISVISACSLPPERPITEGELMPIFKAFELVESPEEVLAVLNKEGEVTVPVTFKGKPYTVRILATPRGLVFEYYQK